MESPEGIFWNLAGLYAIYRPLTMSIGLGYVDKRELSTVWEGGEWPIVGKKKETACLCYNANHEGTD